jgi:DNA mismatch endonuclease (patch repair protein)
LADIVTPEKRSEMMAGIRGKNTRGELIVRRGLHRMGFRFRLHDAKLPGKPDIVLPRYKAVILVHGCFWHGHGCHLFKWPSSRIDFWKTKITRNQQKDVETLVELKELGWRVLIIWECATKGKSKVPLNRMLELIAEWVVKGGQILEVRSTDVN